MDEASIYGRLAAHSLLTSFTLALVARHDANPADAIEEVLESMKSAVDEAKSALADTASPDCAVRFAASFNSELDSLRSMAAKMMASMSAY